MSNMSSMYYMSNMPNIPNMASLLIPQECSKVLKGDDTKTVMCLRHVITGVLREVDTKVLKTRCF